MIAIYERATKKIVGYSTDNATIEQLYPDNIRVQEAYAVIEVEHGREVVDNRSRYKVLEGSLVKEEIAPPANPPVSQEQRIADLESALIGVIGGRLTQTEKDKIVTRLTRNEPIETENREYVVVENPVEPEIRTRE